MQQRQQRHTAVCSDDVETKRFPFFIRLFFATIYAGNTSIKLVSFYFCLHLNYITLVVYMCLYIFFASYYYFLSSVEANIYIYTFEWRCAKNISFAETQTLNWYVGLNVNIVMRNNVDFALPIQYCLHMIFFSLSRSFLLSSIIYSEMACVFLVIVSSFSSIDLILEL